VRPLGRWVLVFWLAGIYLYTFPFFGDRRPTDEWPRILTTEEIVHHKTFDLGARLDELGSTANLLATPKGRIYASVAPGLSILAVPVYAPLAFFYRLFHHATPPRPVTTWLLRVTLVTLPAVLFLGAFRRLAGRFSRGDAVGRDGALLAYGLGSMAFPYALVFTSQVPAAVAIGTAFALAVHLTRRESDSTRRDALGIGALLGLAVLIDYQAIFAAATLALYVAFRAPSRGRTLGLVAVSATPSLLALAAYNAACFGSPLQTGHAYAGTGAGLIGFVWASIRSLLELLSPSSNDLLILSPWILLAVLGAVAIARDPAWRASVGAEALVAGVIAIVHLFFVVSLDPDPGRPGIGPHHFAVAMPFFGCLAAAGLASCAGREWLRVPALATILVSVVVHVLAGTTYPEWPAHPVNPVYEIAIRLLREGHAPHSLGTAMGLSGLASLVPVYIAAAAVVAALLTSAGVSRLPLAGATLLAALAVWRYGDLRKTEEPLRSQLYSYVVSTYEPGGDPRRSADPSPLPDRRSNGSRAGAPLLAPTPPMGWNGFNKFAIKVSEALVLQTTDALQSSGMAAAGYQYVIIDDGWQATRRDRSGDLLPDAKRFPNGIGAVAKYVHDKGLKLGIYSDRGTETCGGLPGSFGYETRDARAFASWGIDLVKYDNCHASPSSAGIQADFEAMGSALQATGRPIVYSVSAWWFFAWEPSVAQLWRTTSDIRDTWSSVMAILDCNGGDTTRYGSCAPCLTTVGGGCGVCNAALPEAAFGAPGLAPVAGPGHWNDPDMLEVGNDGMTDTEYRSHFSLWAIMAAPLIAGNDVTQMSDATRATLMNREVIAVDQDPLGKQGTPVGASTTLEVWAKPLSGKDTYAVVLLNRTENPADISVTWSSLGLTSANATVRDLWNHHELGGIPNGYTARNVPSHGVVMIKVSRL
jgi:alpha-galactosidase